MTNGHFLSIIPIMTIGHFKERSFVMQKFGKFICKHRTLILVIALLLLIPSIIGMKATKINYDILLYLPEEVETIQGERILSQDLV